MTKKPEMIITPISMAMIGFSSIGMQSDCLMEQRNMLAVCKSLEQMLEYENDYIKAKIEKAREEGRRQGREEAIRVKLLQPSKN